jgi:hypothetical protein
MKDGGDRNIKDIKEIPKKEKNRKHSLRELKRIRLHIHTNILEGERIDLCSTIH